jgi:hypothetical protein
MRPHLSAASPSERNAKRELVKALKRIPVMAFVDVLINVDAAQAVLASALPQLGPAEENLNDVLRGALRMSLDRAHPLWQPEWIEEHSLIGETTEALTRL